MRTKLLCLICLLTLNMCSSNSCEKYATRQYGGDEYLKTIPPLLLSYHGSGNTWVRLLIEYATGIYTGSIYDDESLLNVLPAEKFCGRRMIAIKAHPVDIKVGGSKTGEPIIFLGDKPRAKCKKGMIKNFDKAIVIIRDPYHAIWADYQRWTNEQNNSRNSHMGGIKVSQFNLDEWRFNALLISKRYASIFNYALGTIFAFKQQHHLLVHYEELIDVSQRESVLRRLVTFLQQTANVTSERLRCAFELAENPTIHRNISSLSVASTGNSSISSTTVDRFVTIQEAYASVELICAMWSSLTNSQFMFFTIKYGYRPWNNSPCVASKYTAQRNDSLLSNIPDELLY